MHFSKHFNSRSLAYLALAGVVVLTPSKGFASATPQQEQQQSQPPPQQNPQPSSQQPTTTAQQAPKQRKVWTNEDLILLRTPADIYLLEKEAREAAEAEAAKIAAEAKPVTEAPLEIKLPASIEETQLLLKNKEQEIADKQAALASLKDELPNTAPEQKTAKQKEIDVLSADLETAEKERKALQDNLERLNKPPGASTPPTISTPPPPNPPPSP